MTVDVVTSAIIDRPWLEVAEYAGNPGNAPEWYVNINSVQWKTPPPLRIGARVAFVAHFLGRRLTYTYEVVELVPGERLVMRTADGPFPMETTYTWEPLGESQTRMTLYNRGEPSGFGKLAASLMSSAMRRANCKDLQRLKSILEAREAPLLPGAMCLSRAMRGTSANMAPMRRSSRVWWWGAPATLLHVSMPLRSIANRSPDWIDQSNATILGAHPP